MTKHVAKLAFVILLLGILGIDTSDRWSYWADDYATLFFGLSCCVLITAEMHYHHWIKTDIAQKYRLPRLSYGEDYGFEYKIPRWFGLIVALARIIFIGCAIWFGYPDFLDAPNSLWVAVAVLTSVIIVWNLYCLWSDITDFNRYYLTEELRYEKAEQMLAGWCLRENTCREHRPPPWREWKNRKRAQSAFSQERRK